MDRTNHEEDLPRPETVAAALIHLLAHYQRNRCPRVAVCIARHLQCLAMDPEAAPVLRGVCSEVLRSWSQPMSCDERRARARQH